LFNQINQSILLKMF